MRLYRFKDLVGNTSIVSLLKRSCNNNSFPHFVLMCGVEGTGKSTCAEIAALYLSCEHPVDGEPCLECKTCRDNLRALKANNGSSYHLAKKNMGLLNSNQDVKSLIKDVFDLESDGSKVFILEEIHSLNEIQQTSLLEEIDRLDDNTYIIGCTTQKYRIVSPLRSRATIFDFNRLNSKESDLLVHTYMSRTRREFSKDIEKKILKYCKGIPRQITNLIDFIWDTAPTVEEINKFLGVINESDFCNLFLSLKGNMSDMARELDELLGENNVDNLVHQLKELFVDIVFYVSCGVSVKLERNTKEVISEVFDKDSILKVGNIVNKLDERTCSESEFKIAFITIYQLLRKRKVSDLETTCSRDATKDYEDSKISRSELLEYKEDKLNEKSTALDMDVFSRFRRR